MTRVPSDAGVIARGLAALRYPPNDEDGYCMLCSLSDEDRTHFGFHHKPSCPWRLAREWVEQHPAP